MFVSRRVRDRAIAEDITSAVFERALEHVGRFEWRGVPFGAWLFRIASNLIAERWRDEARRADSLPEVADAQESADIERRVLLFELVDQLPDAQRAVILQRFVDGRTIREIATALDRSEGAVKQLQLRALETLRKRMERHG